MRILVTGSTGTIGSRVARELVQRGADVVGLTRSPDSARDRVSMPQDASGNLEFVAGDLERPHSFADALKQVERLFLVTPLHPSEAELGCSAVRAAEDAGIDRLVIITVHQADAAPQVPHFASKVVIREAARESGIPFIEIAPNSIFQNDLWLYDALMSGGVYPNPTGDIGLNRVDADDIAHAVANALTQDIEVEGPVPLVGPDALTGEQMAAIWSKQLRKPIRYVGDLDAWASNARASLPGWMADDLMLMLRHFTDSGLLATEADLRTQQRVLQRAPRPFSDFVAATAAQWTESS